MLRADVRLMPGVHGMRIECPGCEATYEVPEAQIRPGRSVRCVRCEGQWRPAGDLPETVAALPAMPAPVHEAVRDGIVRLRQPAHAAQPKPAVEVLEAVVDGSGPSPARSWRNLTTSGTGWAASLILLGLLAVSAVHWRTAIMEEWPPSIRLYTALGAPPPPG